MELNYTKEGNAVIVYLKGRLDVHQVEDIEKEIKRLLNEEANSHFLFNLKDIDYVSSSGLGLFVTVLNVLKQRGKLFSICALNSSVRRIMEIVEMDRLFNIFREESEALEFLKESK